MLTNGRQCGCAVPWPLECVRVTSTLYLDLPMALVFCCHPRNSRRATALPVASGSSKSLQIYIIVALGQNCGRRHSRARMENGQG